MRQYWLLLASIFVSRCLASSDMPIGQQGGLDEDNVSFFSGTSMPNTYSFRPRDLMSTVFESIIDKFEFKVKGFNSVEGMSLDEFKSVSRKSVDWVSSMHVEYAKMAGMMAIGISTKDISTIMIYGLMLDACQSLCLINLKTCGHARTLLEDLSNVSVDTQAQASNLLESSAMQSDLTSTETISGGELAARNGFANQELRTRTSQLARYICQLELVGVFKEAILVILLILTYVKPNANIALLICSWFNLLFRMIVREIEK